MIRLDSVGVNAARFAPNIMTSWQICRERSCAVPFGRVAEGVKPLPYERSHSRAREAGYGDLPFNISIGDLRLVRVRGLPTRAFSAGVLRERPERSRRKSRLPRPSNDCRVDALPELGLAVTDPPVIASEPGIAVTDSLVLGLIPHPCQCFLLLPRRQV